MASKKTTKRYLYLTNDKKYEVTGENGKYFICGDTQFRKGNAEIRNLEIEEVKASKKKAEIEDNDGIVLDEYDEIVADEEADDEFISAANAAKKEG